MKKNDVTNVHNMSQLTVFESGKEYLDDIHQNSDSTSILIKDFQLNDGKKTVKKLISCWVKDDILI